MSLANPSRLSPDRQPVRFRKDSHAAVRFVGGGGRDETFGNNFGIKSSGNAWVFSTEEDRVRRNNEVVMKFRDMFCMLMIV